MLSHCLKCKKKKSVNPKVSKTNNGKTMILSKYAICCSKKSRFHKKQEASGILSNLGLKTLNKIPLLGDILFWWMLSKIIKVNEIVNKFLLAGDKFMPKVHLKQPGFTYSACGPFTKNKENSKF